MFGNAQRFNLVNEPTPVDVSVKIRYDDSIVRVGTRHLTEDWATFVNRLRTLTGQAFVGLESGHPTRLTYTDDEGDLITVRSSCELVEAYRCQRGIRKFSVERLVTDSTQAPCVPLMMVEVKLTEQTPDMKGVEVEEGTPVSPSCPVQTSVPTEATHCKKWCKGQKKMGKMDPNQKLLHLIRSGRLRKADTFFQKHGEAGQFNNNYVFLYNGACLYTRMNRLQYAAKLLERSVIAGYRDATNLMTDTDLNELRATPDFETVVQLLLALTAETPRPAVVPTEETSSPTTPAAAVAEHDTVVEELEKVESEEPFEYQSTLNALVAMGIEDTSVLRQIVSEEKGNMANVIDRILM